MSRTAHKNKILDGMILGALLTVAAFLGGFWLSAVLFEIVRMACRK